MAWYGPDNAFASKVAVGIIMGENQETAFLERWYSQEGVDVRHDPRIGQEVKAFIQEHGARSVVASDRIMGCPHEEGVDYPDGESCPQCPFWQGRNRFTHKREH